MKTSELIGRSLDWAVAKALDIPVQWTRYFITTSTDHHTKWTTADEFSPSTDWILAGPVLTEHNINRITNNAGFWFAYTGHNLNHKHTNCHKSELVAGLRCLVELRLGLEIDVPNILK